MFCLLAAAELDWDTVWDTARGVSTVISTGLFYEHTVILVEKLLSLIKQQTITLSTPTTACFESRPGLRQQPAATTV